METMDTECKVCGGTGWKSLPAQASPVGGKKPSPQVARCDCRIGAKTNRLLANARIPKRYEHCSLGSFQTEFDGDHDKHLSNGLLMAGRMVEEYPTPDGRGLLLIGDVGVGKTHLAVGIIKALIENKNAQCLFLDYRELLKEIQNSYNASVNATELGILRPVFEAEVLVLDELGAVKPSEWVWDTVSLIINTRYNDKRTTIITTNYPDAPAAPAGLDQLQQLARPLTLGDRIGDRMLSRLHEMCKIVQVPGKDFRQKRKSPSLR
jgi:DNA replication protein DnaC